MNTNGNTYDLTPPRPPNITDFNGAEKEDDAEEPPDPNTMPNAPEWNTVEQTLVAMGAMCPLAEVAVTAGSLPAISNVLSPSSAVNGNPAAFYLTRNAAGDYWVETGNGSVAFPAVSGSPKSWITSLTAGTVAISQGTIVCQYGTGPNSQQAIRVRTYAAGSLTDMNFCVSFR